MDQEKRIEELEARVKLLEDKLLEVAANGLKTKINLEELSGLLCKNSELGVQQSELLKGLIAQVNYITRINMQKSP